jgi:NADH:ubiquinone oxidoreductase subunit E
MEIKVCIGSACHLKGSYEVIKRIQAYIVKYNLEKSTTLKSSFCLGQCSTAVSMLINNEDYFSVTPDTIEQILNDYRL